jgi:predicted solute-binding protein
MCCNRADVQAMEGSSVEEELKLTNQKLTMGDTALEMHQHMTERQMRNIIRDKLKQI